MNWKRAILCVFIVVLLAVLAAFPYGPLFAWSPLHPGYEQVEFSRTELLYPDGAVFDPGYREIDRYVETAESFHEMKCSTKVKVVICRSWGDCLRFAPFLGTQRPLAVTFPTGTVIFVTPRTAAPVDIGGLLRHELSHAVLNQNRSLVSVLRMLQQPWVSEGVAGVVAEMGATAPGRQLVSLPEAEFRSRAMTEDLWPCFAAAPQKDWRFSYTAWLSFWDWEIDRKGKKTFLTFERACIDDPPACRTTFADVYGTELRKAVEEFQAAVRERPLMPSIPLRIMKHDSGGSARN